MFHILLIDDRPEALALTRERPTTQPRRCQLHHIAEGERVLEILHLAVDERDAPRPDLIVLNLGLGQISGLDVLARIKGDPHWHALPVVAMSAADDPDTVARAYALHANCCVPRPADDVTFAQLMYSIEHFWTTIAKLPLHH